tara:strand:+ start:233 stop:2278 length:2046 start_codon:yes stop_codon:yes gene_type:complete
MARPDRQRKGKDGKPEQVNRDQRYFFNYQTGKRELRREFRPDYDPGPNPLAVKQFPDPLPDGMVPKRPDPKPFELPSDYPDAPKGLPPVPDFVKQMEQQRTQSGLRQRLEEKRNQKRKETAFRTASDRRNSRRVGTRVFRDPANLNRYLNRLDRERDRSEVRTPANRKIDDMDDTIIKSDDGQAFRYDAEIDGFTPVRFNPETNQYDFDGPKKEEPTAPGKFSTATKEAQQEFDKQMAELRRLSDTDKQFGDMYSDLQSEYMEVLRDPNLRPEEREAQLNDLFDRGAATFEQTSGFRRAAAEAEQQQRSQAAKVKQAEKLEFDNRRAVEAKEKIRRDQENARYEDRRVRQKHSATTQELDKAYADYKKGFEATQETDFFSDTSEKPLSMEEFTAQHYRRMHEDEEISDQIRDTDGRIAIIETEIGQLEGEDPMAYRDTLTEIYGAGRQEEADAAFQDYLNTRSARIAGAKRRLNEMKAVRRDLVNSKSLVYDEKYRSAAAQQDRKARNLEAINESRRVQEEERVGLVGGLYRSGRQIEEIQEGTREVARGTEKLATREAMLQRDSNPMSPTFGQSTRIDSPEYIRDLTGDRTLLGDLRRLAESEKNMDKRKKYGGEQVYREKRMRAIKAIEGVIQKENPAGSDGYSAIQDPQELRRQAADRFAQIMRFEQSLSEEQMGDRG